MWRHVKLSVQIGPRDTLACCWDVKPPTSQPTNIMADSLPPEKSYPGGHRGRPRNKHTHPTTCFLLDPPHSAVPPPLPLLPLSLHTLYVPTCAHRFLVSPPSPSLSPLSLTPSPLQLGGKPNTSPCPFPRFHLLPFLLVFVPSVRSCDVLLVTDTVPCVEES